MMTEFRNPTYNQFGSIDLEVNHPQLGWIPFTASADDPEEYGRTLFAEATAGEVAPYVEPGPVPAPIPDRVTARQFKLQLLAAGLLDQVEAWIASQSQAVQIAYANSGTFVRDEPMMQAGFAALGFTPEQIDEFFTAAAAL
jgi:hypothetical protein